MRSSTKGHSVAGIKNERRAKTATDPIVILLAAAAMAAIATRLRITVAWDMARGSWLGSGQEYWKSRGPHG